MANAEMIVTNKLLCELFHMPEGTEILGATMDFDDLMKDQTRFIVSHPNIPAGTHNVKPSLLTYYDDNGKVVKIEFIEWLAR